eukprot:m.117463 g.117463  ORF g.117463 m.117463 type:complete len:95 (-) comp28582_c2_seq2:53-337(-)
MEPATWAVLKQELADQEIALARQATIRGQWERNGANKSMLHTVMNYAAKEMKEQRTLKSMNLVARSQRLAELLEEEEYQFSLELRAQGLAVRSR